MRIPELLFPLVAKGITRLPEQVLTFWHESLVFVWPPGSRAVITYRPRQGYMYLVFGMTLGRPRNFVTGDILTTDDYGFWHRHGQMRWHWDPAIEAIYEFEYPHWLEVTRDDPAELEFVNNAVDPATGEPITVIQDFSIWILECGEPQWRDYVVPYLRGLYKVLSTFGRMSEKEVAKALKGE